MVTITKEIPMQFSSQYPLKPFQQEDWAKVRLVIKEYPLATLIIQSEGYPIVTQVPLILDKSEKKLLGHFDRNNPHCAAIRGGSPIYCLFNGPNHYITPSIYPDEQYPGWNYVAVHIKGFVRTIDDEVRLSEILLQTASENEPAGSGYTLTPAQTNYHRFIKMILGFEIEILDFKGVFKLALDKSPENVQLAARHLNEVEKRDISDFLGLLLA